MKKNEQSKSNINSFEEHIIKNSLNQDDIDNVMSDYSFFKEFFRDSSGKLNSNATKRDEMLGEVVNAPALTTYGHLATIAGELNEKAEISDKKKL